MAWTLKKDISDYLMVLAINLIAVSGFAIIRLLNEIRKRF